MQALVTGGSGFIGSELIRHLLKNGFKVRVLLRETSPLNNLEGLEYQPYYGSLSDKESLKSAVKGVDYVFHLAGAINAKNRDDFFLHNSTGTANLAQACSEVNPNLKRFLYVSSMAASGPANSRDPKDESEPEAPVSNYGASKLGGEKALREVSYPVTVLRPPAVYGPRDRGIFEFIKIINSGVMPIFSASNGSGEKFYSVIHVEDLVTAIFLGATANGQSGHEIFFICGDGVYSWVEVMSSMANSLRKKPIRISLPSFALDGLAAFYTAIGFLFRRQFPLNFEKLSELKADYWVCSNERAKKVLGFQPKWDLNNGMHYTIDWYKNNGWI